MKRRGVALLLLLLAGCEPDGQPVTYFGRTLHEVEASRELTYVAVRRYVDYVGAVPGVLTERFVKGPQGTYRVDLLALNGEAPGDPEMNPAEAAAFAGMQALLAGGLGTYVATSRDFRLRDFVLLDANYHFAVQGGIEVIAGRPARKATVTPTLMDRPSYVVWVDDETLVTLRYREYVPSGALSGEMEVLEIEYAPSLTNEELRAPLPFTEVPVAQLGAHLTSPVFVPTYLPQGFLLSSSRVAQLANLNVVILTYTDGLQEIFLAQYAELQPTSPPLDLPGSVAVQLHAYGVTSETLFGLGGTAVHAWSKMEPAELAFVIESLDVQP